MPTITLERPGGEGESFVSEARACVWLSVSPSTFQRLIGRRKGKGAFAGAFAWVRSQKVGKQRMYAVEDLAVMRHVLLASGVALDDDDDEPEEK